MLEKLIFRTWRFLSRFFFREESSFCDFEDGEDGAWIPRVAAINWNEISNDLVRSFVVISRNIRRKEEWESNLTHNSKMNLFFFLGRIWILQRYNFSILSGYRSRNYSKSRSWNGRRGRKTRNIFHLITDRLPPPRADRRGIRTGDRNSRFHESSVLNTSRHVL